MIMKLYRFADDFILLLKEKLKLEKTEINLIYEVGILIIDEKKVVKCVIIRVQVKNWK